VAQLLCQNSRKFSAQLSCRTVSGLTHLISRIAVELDAKLQSLDSASAEALTRKVREAIAAVEAAEPPFVNPAIDPMLGVENGWPVGYFSSTLGMFADEPFKRPAQGDHQECNAW
jgi:hypothetical protein